MSVKDKWVRRFSVDQTAKHKNGFTIYKVTSVLFPIESPEAVTVVSVWKRYSDVQRLHKSMHSLHTGLHLRGTFPMLSKYSYFKRFQPEVIEERAKTIKSLLEFIAEHKLLFTSTDFVNFLQTGYPEPETNDGSVINAIRSSLHLPIEETPPLEYQTSDDDTRSPTHTATAQQTDDNSSNPLDTDISQIPIYEAADVEIRETSNKQKLSDSFESLSSLDSIKSDLYDELNKITIEKTKPCVRSKSVLPDLINFDAPSTSKFEDYHTMPKNSNTDSDTVSLSSTVCGPSSVCDLESRRSSSRVSLYSRKSVLSLSNLECKTKTEDSYVFEAGYMLNLAARCEDMGDYHRAFECYKSGIEKMLIGVQTDTDPQRRALIKEKTNKYLSYAEAIYKNHLCNTDQSLLQEREEASVLRAMHCPLPISMLKRPYEELSLYRVLAVLGPSVMLVLHRSEQTCYAMKVVQKIPNNLTEFDEYFLQRVNETREPVLPTNIPYMVPIHAYIETKNLIFLILTYAPGEKLFDYIKNYAKSIPNTPAREVNLENVFFEPTKHKIDLENDNIHSDLVKTEIDKVGNIDRLEVNKKNSNNNPDIEIKTDDMDNIEVSVNDLVINSQKLLLNVEKALNETPRSEVSDERDANNEIVEERKETVVEGEIETGYNVRADSECACVLPQRAVRTWAAQILLALESLHNAGIVCRDLNPDNILLGDRGQVILTYFISYPGSDMALAAVTKRTASRRYGMYVAPELYVNVLADADRDDSAERVCDYWSFGVLLYQLLCGVPLSSHHEAFTSHTILHLPDGLPIEAHSLLSQLLTYDPSARLGAGRDGVDEIKRHPYFKHVDWQSVYDTWIVPD